MPSSRVPTTITTGGGPPPPAGVGENVALALTAHITDPTGAHAASAISSATTSNWENGYGFPAADVQTDLNKIVDDLASTATGWPEAGSDKIGSPDLITWADGTNITARSIRDQLDFIIADLRGNGFSGAGARKVGAPFINNTTVYIAPGAIADQLATLSGAAGIQYEGGDNWADGTTNPATNVEAQIDKILTELGTTASPGGAARIGSIASTVGTTTITANTIHYRMTQLQSAANIAAGARPAWRDGKTNVDIDVAAALGAIVNDLNDAVGAQNGSTKVGAPAYPGTSSPDDYVLLVGSVGSQLQQLCDKIHPKVDSKTVGTGGLVIFNQLNYQRCVVHFLSSVTASETFNWSDALVTPLDGQRYTLIFKQQTSGAGAGTANMTSWGKWVFSGTGDENLAVGLGVMTIYEFEYSVLDDLYYCLNKVVFP